MESRKIYKSSNIYQKTDIAANNSFKGTDISVTGSVWSTGVGGSVGFVKGKVEAFLGSISVDGIETSIN